MKFNYQARTPRGEIQTGVIEASSREAAFEILTRYNLVVTALEAQAETPIFARSVRIFGGVNRRDLVVFSRNLATLFSAGVFLRDALRTIAQQTPKEVFRQVIHNIADDIEAGSPFWRALGKHPKVFKQMYVQLVRSGETAGKLSETLEQLAEQLERDYQFISELRGALIYPVMVLIVFIAVFFVMTVFVLPKLASAIGELGKDLPLATKIVLGISNLVGSFWYIFILIFIGGIVAVRRLYKNPRGKLFLDAALLHLPIFGEVFRKLSIVRFVDDFSILISGGVPIGQSLEIVYDVMGNEVYRNIVKEAQGAVQRGATISSVFMQHKEIPPLVTQMLVVGEKSGNLSTMLQKIGKFYQTEINRIVANLSNVFAPLLIVILGVGVGILVAAVLVPMYSVMLQGV